MKATTEQLQSVDDPFVLNEMLVAGGVWDRYWGAAIAGSMETCLQPSDQWNRIPSVRASRLSAEEMLGATISQNVVSGQNRGIGLFIPGSAIVGKRVVEIGCGYGELARQLLPWTSRFLGLDVSRLVISVAKSGVRSRRLRYAWLGDNDVFKDFEGTFDTIVSQNVFFHLNLRHAIGVLGRAGRLLRPGGAATLELCTIVPGSIAGVVHESTSDLDPNHPTAGYRFTDADIGRLVNASGFRVESELDLGDQGRKLLRLVRVG